MSTTVKLAVANARRIAPHPPYRSTTSKKTGNLLQSSSATVWGTLAEQAPAPPGEASTQKTWSWASKVMSTKQHGASTAASMSSCCAQVERRKAKLLLPPSGGPTR